MMEPRGNPLAAIRTVLLADAKVAQMTGGRVFVPELPRKEAQEMPRACVVVRGTGGSSLGPGARSRVPWTITRLDIQSFGKWPYDANQLHWAVYDVMTSLARTEADDIILHDATCTGGPIDDRDADADWPFTLGVYDLSSAYYIP